jgi:glycosyltransferase involved in cell wall biosynthesis
VEVFGRVGLPARAVPNIVDFHQFRFRPRAPLEPVFLANRNFEAHYNVSCVLRAFARIQQRHPDARLIVAGDGSQRALLLRLARELQLRNTEFVGQVLPDRMPALYDAADVYLNAPEVDNMPASILEAFASGLAVVTTDAGGIPYIVRHAVTGLIVPRGDYEKMAAAALHLLQDPALAERLISTAVEECRRRYTPEAVASEWRRVYEALVASAAVPGGGGRPAGRERQVR